MRPKGPGVPTQVLERLLRTLSDRAGLEIPEQRRPDVANAFAQMAGDRSAESEELLRLLDEDDELLTSLVGRLTVRESYFFRDPDQLREIEDRVLPDLLRRAEAGRPIRIWSAGCARGEEPFTLAILLHRAGLLDRARILATDISRSALDRAAAGWFRPWSLRATPVDVLERYFRPTRGGYELIPEIQRAVHFRLLNLAEAGYPSVTSGTVALDMILCRNVLIYFHPAAVARCLERLQDCLGEGGWLVLGASDPPIEDAKRVRPVTTDAGLLYTAAPPEGDGGSARGSGAAERPRRPVVKSPAPPVHPHREAPPEASAVDRARRLYEERDYPAAAAAAREATVDPREESPEPWVLLVRSLGNAGRLEDAVRAAAGGIEAHPLHAELRYLRAVLLSQAGRDAAAIRAAREALYADAGFAMAHLLLGTLLARTGDRRGAERAFQNAIERLERMDPSASVAGSDGETAGRLAATARCQCGVARREAV